MVDWTAAQAAVTAAIPVAVGATIIKGVMDTGKKRRAKTVSRKPKKKEVAKMAETTASLAKKLGISKTKIIEGRKYELVSTPRSKEEADRSVKAREDYLSGDAVAVPIGKGKYVVYHTFEKKKRVGKVSIQTVKEKTRSQSRSKTPKTPKELRSRSGTIETRGGRGHIRL